MRQIVVSVVVAFCLLLSGSQGTPAPRAGARAPQSTCQMDAAYLSAAHKAAATYAAINGELASWTPGPSVRRVHALAAKWALTLVDLKKTNWAQCNPDIAWFIDVSLKTSGRLEQVTTTDEAWTVMDSWGRLIPLVAATKTTKYGW